jgi:hypothetical protein
VTSLSSLSKPELRKDNYKTLVAAGFSLRFNEQARTLCALGPGFLTIA